MKSLPRSARIKTETESRSQETGKIGPVAVTDIVKTLLLMFTTRNRLFRPLGIGVKTDARMSDQKEFLSEGLFLVALTVAQAYSQPRVKFLPRIRRRLSANSQQP